MPSVSFLPIGRRIEVRPGTSLLEAARSSGIHLRNDCGGQGTCGRCVVRVLSGSGAHLSSRHGLPEGEVLACRFLVLESDVSVFIPRTSLEATEEVTVTAGQVAPAEFPPETAIVRERTVQLSPPTLEDTFPDHERLMRTLAEQSPARYEVLLRVLQSLPGAVRAAQWQPHVVLGVSDDRSLVLGVHGREGPRPAILAVDIGTTTLKTELLAAGRRWVASCYNSQSLCGPDVISRIIYCQQHEGGLTRLQSLVVGDINRMIGALLERARLSRDDLWAVVAAGNTTMMHLLLGVEPAWIRREPYVGGVYRTPPLRAADVGISIHPNGLLYVLPAVASYVGSDVTAGVLATGLDRKARPTMFIDLGTNGEIVIGNRDFMVCCSASAGTAFEGEASASGTRAMPGAIDRVWFNGTFQWQTIEGRPPVGICGSGYIDLLAVLLEQGLVDRTGRFQPDSHPSVRPSIQDTFECVVVNAEDAAGESDIILAQGDVDNLVRAKAAIYAAASALLESLGMKWDDLESILLAGAFGDRLNIESAVRIGLLPDVPRQRISFVGNTSLKGAVMAALDASNLARLHDISRAMTYFELSTHPRYMEQFVAACFLPHTDTSRFPSAAPNAGSTASSTRTGD